MDREKIKVAMTVSVSKALGYKEEFDDILDPDWPEVYQKILPEIEQTRDRRAKMAMIAAISKAIKYAEEYPKAREKQIIKHVMKEFDEILDNVEKYG